MNHLVYFKRISRSVSSTMKKAKTYFTMLEEDEPVPFSDLMWLLALLVSTLAVFAICLLV